MDRSYMLTMLENVLTEQILDLKVNEISPSETEMYSVYFDRRKLCLNHIFQ